MGDKISIKVDPREVFGKKVTQLRRQGLTPGIVYGPGIDPLPVQVESIELRKVVAQAGKHSPVHLTGSKRRIAMIKDVTLDPTRNSIRHVSFHAVKADEPVEAEVPIKLIGEGESEAERAGLVILQSLETVMVKALPMDLPSELDVDITGLVEAGERVTVGDIKVPANVELVDKIAAEATSNDEEETEKPSVTDLVVATVYEPSALQAANEAAAGNAEPGDEADVEADNGSDTDQESQDVETRPGGKGQDEPKQSNVDANN